ncbi:glutamate ABC transporter substrate-binding protein [Agromyces flavus]|uniref:Amino acid ABC transporter substrate-binding protein, PAAT family n=1 Tax=Agromyces flavus TaxID=589382 RepID=A0A1H1SVX4_9MICO|nr:glutamate ABC transporter substrate-binding protein [Agromyces flavus]GGI48742.1 glutamate-binding protein [Agromyces flavus]SDS52094.1 amino acid ABC transporter substrate-binding protein, PAAT family [Agromyces flavus]
MRRSRIALVAAAAATALLFSGCAADAGTPGGGDEAEPSVEETPEFDEGTTMAALADEGSITIGTKFDQPLFGLVGPDGVPVGFDVEIGKIIAGKLGIAPEDIEWVETVSANREPFIENGQVDLVVATYTINDKRKEVVDFAGPYFEAGQSILVLEDNDTIESEEDLVGQPVCSVTGSTPAANLAELGAQVIETDTYSNCLEPLRSGQAVAVSTDNVILAGLIDQNPGEFKLVGEPFTQEPYGIGLKKGDDDFRDFINDVLEESYEDGTYEEAWDATAGKVLEFREPPAVDRY